MSDENEVHAYAIRREGAGYYIEDETGATIVGPLDSRNHATELVVRFRAADRENANNE